MKVVIDSNRLRCGELLAFLAASRSNKAVLIDYAMVEAYKKQASETVFRSMAMVARYPRQVLVLRSTGTVYRLDPRKPDMTGRMVWTEHTRTFPLFVRQVAALADGAPGATEWVRGMERQARSLMARRGIEVDLLVSMFLSAAAEFPAAYHRTYRETGAPPDDALGGILSVARTIAAARLGDEDFDRGLDQAAALNHFAIRHAIASVLQMFQWVRDGRPVDVARSRLENDAVDAVFVTFGTFFNGLMTGDRNADRLHSDRRALLRRLSGTRAGRARVPEPYEPPVRA